MEIKSTINIILKDLEEARNLIDDLKNYPGVPVLQIELAKAKCRSAEDVIKLLITLQDQFPVVQQPEMVLKKEETEKQIEDDSHQPIVPLKDKTENVSDRKQRTEKITRLVDEIVSQSHSEEDVKRKAKGKKIVADSFSHLSNRINERLGDQKKDDDQGIKISRPVTNLTKAIGVNDRYYFIREVFDGNQEKYSKVISEIDDIGSIGEAIEIIRSNINSEIEDEPVQQLIELVKRKFTHSKNE